MATTQLKNDKILFTNSESNTGAISFNTDEQFVVNKMAKFSAGLQAVNMSVGDGGSLTATSDFDTASAESLRIKDANDASQYITIQVTTGVTPYTIKFPAAQGAAGTFLKNDGSGNLSWST